MPVMDGYEFVERLRSFYNDKNVPQPMIVACTGHVEDEFIKKAWAAEFDEVIPKPVDIEILR